MRKIFLVILPLFVVFSCTQEQVVTPDETESATLLKGERTPPPPGLLCEEATYLKPITSDSRWNIGSNNFKHIDYMVEERLAASWKFNLRLIKRTPPVQIGEGDVFFQETENIFGEYDVLNSELSVSDGEAVKEILACKLVDFMELNYPELTTSNIYDVDVFGDALICGSLCSSRFLRATFKVGK